MGKKIKDIEAKPNLFPSVFRLIATLAFFIAIGVAIYNPLSFSTAIVTALSMLFGLVGTGFAFSTYSEFQHYKMLVRREKTKKAMYNKDPEARRKAIENEKERLKKIPTLRSVDFSKTDPKPAESREIHTPYVPPLAHASHEPTSQSERKPSVTVVQPLNGTRAEKRNGIAVSMPFEQSAPAVELALDVGIAEEHESENNHATSKTNDSIPTAAAEPQRDGTSEGQFENASFTRNENERAPEYGTGSGGGFSKPPKKPNGVIGWFKQYWFLVVIALVAVAALWIYIHKQHNHKAVTTNQIVVDSSGTKLAKDSGKKNAGKLQKTNQSQQENERRKQQLQKKVAQNQQKTGSPIQEQHQNSPKKVSQQENDNPATTEQVTVAPTASSNLIVDYGIGALGLLLLVISFFQPRKNDHEKSRQNIIRTVAIVLISFGFIWLAFKKAVFINQTPSQRTHLIDSLNNWYQTHPVRIVDSVVYTDPLVVAENQRLKGEVSTLRSQGQSLNNQLADVNHRADSLATLPMEYKPLTHADSIAIYDRIASTVKKPDVKKEEKPVQKTKKNTTKKQKQKSKPAATPCKSVGKINYTADRSNVHLIKKGRSRN